MSARVGLIITYPIMDWFGPEHGPEYDAFLARWEAEFERLNGMSSEEAEARHYDLLQRHQEAMHRGCNVDYEPNHE